MKKTLYISSLTFLILFTSCSAGVKNTDCTNIRKGKFELRLKLDNSVSSIERDDSVQVETNKVTGTVITTRVKWTGSCQFELLFLSQSANQPDSITDYFKDKPLKVTVLQVTKTYYTFESRIDNVDFVYKDTMWIK